MTKDFIERFAELIKDDTELHDAVVRMINAHAEAQEINNYDKRQKPIETKLYEPFENKQYRCTTCLYELYNPGVSPCNGCMNILRNNTQTYPNLWKKKELHEPC